MSNPVFLSTFPAPEVDLKEIFRYAGVKEQTPELKKLIEECLAEAENKFTFNVTYTTFPVKEENGLLDLTFTKTSSSDLKRNLKGAKEVVVFAATVGIGIDRLIAKYSSLSATKAVIFEAIGTERIESLCDAFNAEIIKRYDSEGKRTAPRFSPGYGDCPLEMQRDIFAALNCNKLIGLTLNGSLLMSPSKSVTALIGISENEDCQRQSGCADCNKTDCEYRK